MSFYEERILPWLINLAMRNARLAAYRSRVVPAAAGRVLEVGIGSGINLPFYGTGVSEIVGIEPSPRLLKMTQRTGGRTSTPLKLIEGTAEAIPIDDQTIDTVVTTWTMCSFRFESDDPGILNSPAAVAQRAMFRVFAAHARLLRRAIGLGQTGIDDEPNAYPAA
jgi:ubiquinone/menaquinone biosynthesis C-methylase UbiE